MFSKFIKFVKTISNRYLIFIDKFGLTKQDIHYHTRSGASIYCRPRSTDINEAVVIFSDSEYPQSIIKSLIKPGQYIFDLGANIGSFTMYLRNMGLTNPIIALEPFGSNIHQFQKNISINNYQDIDLVQGVVSAKKGFLNLNTKLDFDAIKIDTSGDLQVESFSLKDLVEKYTISGKILC